MSNQATTPTDAQVERYEYRMWGLTRTELQEALDAPEQPGATADWRERFEKQIAEQTLAVTDWFFACVAGKPWALSQLDRD